MAIMKTYTPHQAAEILQINVQTLRRWLKRGEITGADTPAGWRLSEADIQEWINRYRKPTPTERDEQQI